MAERDEQGKQGDPENPDESDQVRILQRMLAGAEQQLECVKAQTRMSQERSQLSRERSRMSQDRSEMSQDRSEKSEVRSYHNSERTLSVWVRTSQALMVFGIAIDRFGLMLGHSSGEAEAMNHQVQLDAWSSWTGVALVLFAVIMALTTGARFLAFAREWRRHHTPPAYHGPYLASFFAFAVAGFGIFLLFFMLLIAA